MAFLLKLFVNLKEITFLEPRTVKSWAWPLQYSASILSAVHKNSCKIYTPPKFVTLGFGRPERGIYSPFSPLLKALFSRNFLIENSKICYQCYHNFNICIRRKFMVILIWHFVSRIGPHNIMRLIESFVLTVLLGLSKVVLKN